MTYLLELTHEAKLDIDEAWFWYENQKFRLWEEFLISLEAALNHIQRNPLIKQVQHDEVRIGLLRRFLFKVVYTLEKYRIGVVAILHTKHDPSIWIARV
jgi:plasmid stabilization system protein ParE